MRSCTTKAALLAIVLTASGCTNLFLQPDRALHLSPDKVGAKWEELKFKSGDGTDLTGMWFPATKAPAKGVVVQFHGNGENMTSHFLFVYWLALEGWDVLVFDYRGYGASGGEKSLGGAVSDGVAALGQARARAAGRPVMVVGQSLGGALALAALDRDGGDGVRAVVLDSTFSSYRRVAQEKLSHLWLTWPFQWPLSRLLISDRYAPDRVVGRRKAVPLLLLHADGDPVVPAAEGKRLYGLASGPKEYWPVEGEGHTEALGARGAQYRPRLAKFLDEAAKN